MPASAILGGVGRADELTNEWFVEERIHIGARCAGAMERLLDAGRRVGHRAGSSSASGSTTSRASRSRSPTRRRTRRRPGCSPARRPRSPTRAPTRRSSTPRRRSRSCSPREAAWRCADRVVQVFGGRGYMREYPAERFFRELRVDRIWEGTSEIQRLIIARALERRGVGAGRRMSARRPTTSGAAPATRGRRAPPADRPPPAVRPALDRGRRRVRPRRDRRDRPRTTSGSWAARPAATS